MDEYLEWHHHNIRYGATTVFLLTLKALQTGKPARKEGMQEYWNILTNSLKSIEQYWMGAQFMFGSEPTIADLSLACELAQLSAINFPMTDYPKTVKWLELMLALPEMKEVHKDSIPKLIAFTKAKL